MRIVFFFLFCSSFSFTQNTNFQVKISKKSSYYAYFNPIRIKVNGEKMKVRRNSPLILDLAENSHLQINSNHLFSKKLILDTQVSRNQDILLKFKLNPFYLDPVLVKNEE